MPYYLNTVPAGMLLNLGWGKYLHGLSEMLIRFILVLVPDE